MVPAGGGASSGVSDAPGVWTDGSYVVDDLSGVGVGGCWVHSHRSGCGWFDHRWGHLDLLRPDCDLGLERCVLFDSNPGPLQSVQRAERWSVILALQCSSAVHLGVDNLNVIRQVSGILAVRAGRRPFELSTDGDLLTIIEILIRQRGVESVRVSEVEGHADDENGQVW